MGSEQFSSRLLIIAGFGTWFAIGVPVWAALFEAISQGDAIGLRFWFWLIGYLGFGIFFMLDTTGRLESIRRRTPLLLLFIQTMLAAITQIAQPHYGLMAILFIITAVEAAHLMPLKQGILWVVGQTVLVALSTISIYDNVFGVVVQATIYFGFQIFSLFSTYATLSEAKARMELARLNAELRATQELVTESSRMAERLRIARDLHDLIGHHLTALSLNLEVANHVAEGNAKEPIEQAQSLAKLLLSDVRDVVSTMREDENVDVNKALSSLTEGIPKPHIHLLMPPNIQLDDPNRAHVLVRCVQEVITNAIKHAHADNLWIKLESTNDQIFVKAHDDGRGSATIAAGNGFNRNA